MLRHVLAATASLAMVTLASRPAEAAGPFGPQSDILGLSLTMTQAQAKGYVATNYKGNPFADIPVKISTQTYSQNAMAGFFFDAARDKPDEGNLDRLSVFFDPIQGSSDIVGITRTVRFVSQVAFDPSMQHLQLTGTKVLKSVIVDGLFAKYGPPSKTIQQYSVTNVGYMWVLNKAALRNSDCYIQGQTAYWWKNPAPDNADFSYPVAQAGNDFADAINRYDSTSTKKLAECGLVLYVELDLSDYGPAGESANPKYVRNMREYFFDATRLAHELASFRSTFNAAAQKADAAQTQQDSKNAPKL